MAGDDIQSPRRRSTRISKGEPGRTIPKFTVNLSLPPRERYTHIGPHYREAIATSDLPGLFQTILSSLAGPRLGRFFEYLASLLLRRVYSREETDEIIGLRDATGIALHLLVAFNVLLDLLLGCTSGGARVFSEDPNGSESRIVHFRALDWGMDCLRKLIVEIDYVEHEGGPVVASVVTYLGYVGVLTGVRKGLSISLNFRPRHDRSTLAKRVSFHWHQILVVLGYRRSISSHLRKMLFEPVSDGKATTVPDSQVAVMLDRFVPEPSTAAYLVFCTPQRVRSLEKDNCAATVHESDTYLTTCNHDLSEESVPGEHDSVGKALSERDHSTGMAALVGYSLDRKQHVNSMWDEVVSAIVGDKIITMKDVIRFAKDAEISNAQTHYAVVMDPEGGTIVWRRAYEEGEFASTQ